MVDHHSSRDRRTVIPQQISSPVHGGPFMNVVRAVPSSVRAAAVACVLAAFAVGCSGDSTPSAAGSASGGPQDVGYYRCLEDQGVVLEKRDDAQLRVDKDAAAKDPEGMARAEAACKDLLPPRRDAVPPAERLAKAREFSACVRGKGFADYPDPDPETGDVPLPPGIEGTDMERLRVAERACAPGDGTDNGHLGG
ncbi:hypothetical protein GCM10017562_40630 [Streptomyces roseofulvus]